MKKRAKRLNKSIILIGNYKFTETSDQLFAIFEIFFYFLFYFTYLLRYILKNYVIFSSSISKYICLT